MKEGTKTTAGVRSLTHEELREAAWLHTRELPHEFLTRFGPGFLARYYRAFVESPYATALTVPGAAANRLDGVLLATFDTPAHYALLVRRHGLALAGHAALQALRRPVFARDLLRTRLLRYARGIGRGLGRGLGRGTVRSAGSEEGTDASPERVGFMTYVAVAADRRGRGIGGSLLGAYEEQAREAGLERLDLVTFPDERGAGPFYSRTGWTFSEEIVSRSGERYALYTRALRA